MSNIRVGFIALCIFLALGQGQEAIAQCNLEMEIIAECNNNNTPCNGFDDFYEISVIVTNSGMPTSNFLVRSPQLTGGPFPYSPLPVNLGTVPANFGQICLTIVDENDPMCRDEICFEPLEPCAAIFSVPVFEFECDNNRTANDATDDFYRIRLAVGLTLSTWPGRYSVDANGTILGPFEYNTVHEFTLPADGAFTVLRIADDMDPMCSTGRNMEFLNPCSIPCDQNPAILSQICLDQGTPDPTDDLYQISVTSTAVTQGVTGAYRILSQFVPQVPLRYGEVTQLLIPARGQTQTLIFDDWDYDDCTEEVEIGPLDACSALCDVELDSIAYECDDNGTPDPSDDFYRIRMIVSGMDAGSGYNVRIAGDLWGPFDYDSVEVFTVPADGSEPRINFRDVEFPSLCFTFTFAPPLEPCSFPCDLEVGSLITICDDNGTSDPSDDTYTVRINTINNLGSAADRYFVIIDGNQFGPFEYGIDNDIPWPADGQSYTLVIRDQVLGENCELEAPIGPFIPCSSDCELDIQVTNIQCNDAGTGQDPSDDTFTFTLTVNGNNVGPQWRLNDPAMTTRNYGASVNLGPYLISNGNVILVVQDILDSFCRQSVEIIPPAPCSNDCSLEVTSSVIGPCNDNDTGPNRNDDFFFVELIVDGTNAGVSGRYEVVYNAQVVGNYAYSINELVGPLPANGMNLNLIIRDLDDNSCSTTISVRQDPCSDCGPNMANAGPDQLITCSANTVTLMGSANGPGTFVWTGPNGNPINGQNPVVGEPGTYMLTVTFDKECVATDTVEVRRDQNLPFADPGAIQEITCKVDSVTIGGDSTSQGMNLIYIWTDAQGSQVGDTRFLRTGVPGTYCLQVIDTLLDCPSAQNCVEVRENKVAPRGNILVNPNDAFDCRVDSISLTADNGDSTTFYWQRNSVQFYRDTLWVTDTGRVVLILEDTINGCTTELDININSLIDFPVISIAPPDDITCLQEQITIDGSNSQAGPGIMYQWFDGNGQQIPGANSRSLTVDQPGFYTFESMDTVTGCINRDTVEVDEDRVFHTADAGEDALIKCDSTSIILDGSGSTQINNVSYTWRRLVGNGDIINGNGTLFPEIDGQGRFELRVRDELTGCVSTDTVVVDKAFAPMLDKVDVQGERCGGDESGLIDVVGIRGIRPFTYELNGRPVDTTRFDSLRPGLFFFRVTDSLGCYTDTLLEIKEGNYFDFQIEGDTFIIRGDSTTLSVDINIPPDEVDQVYWEEDGSVFCFRCYSVVVKPDSTTTYDFRLIDVNGCSYSFSFVIKVQDANTLFVPNIFTPNGDTENEILHVFGKNLVNLEDVKIFNRWGELVYHGVNIPPGPVWDGYWNGNLHVPAVLTWMIDARFEDGTIKKFTGDVTLLR